MKGYKDFTWTLCLLAALCPGCVAEMDEARTSTRDELSDTSAEGEVADEAEIGESAQDLVAVGEYEWTQGSAEVPMGSSGDRACFLTHVRGNFEGGGEGVYVRQGNGSWWLGGFSQRTGIAARARCVLLTSYSPEFAWSQGNVPTPMGAANGRTCFLTRITGDFAGGGEFVHAYVSQGNWFLGGASQQNGVSARARCVNYASATEYSWTQGSNPVLMESSATKACFLTKMTGNFEGGGEQITIFSSGGSYYLDGLSQQNSVGARARCI